MAGTVATVMVDAFNNLANAPQTMVNTIAGMTGALVGKGQILLTMAFLAELVTATYSWWLEGTAASYLKRMFRLAVVTAIPLAALQNWGEASSLIPRYFQADIRAAISGTDNPLDLMSKVIGVVDQFWRELLTQISRGAVAGAQAVVSNPGAVDPGSGAVDMSGSAPSGGGTFSDILTFGLIPTLVKLVAMAIFVVCVGLPAMIFGATLLATLYGTQILTYVGVVFGPILVCWLPWTPMAWTFQSWIKYMIHMGLTYAVAVLLATVCAKATPAIVSTMTNIAGDDIGVLATVAVVLPLCVALGVTLLFMASLLSKSDNTAQALLSGGGGDTGGGLVGNFNRTMAKSGSFINPAKQIGNSAYQGAKATGKLAYQSGALAIKAIKQDGPAGS